MPEIVIERERERVLDHAKRGRKSHSKSQNCQAKNVHKKDTHVYNNYYELRSRAIKRPNYFLLLSCFPLIFLLRFCQTFAEPKMYKKFPFAEPNIRYSQQTTDRPVA